MNDLVFKAKYDELNPAQKDAVDSIDGPVMVVAGPGTGKTQVLALRIANILTKTDTKADSILCLTFTNSGVKEMRNRLRKYIHAESSKVHISTFHSFGMNIVEKYFEVLDIDEMPKLMDEKDSVSLCDGILHDNDWEYLRPRSDASRYFRDLKNLINLLKRERTNPKDFEVLVKKEIKNIKSDPGSVSSRGATKGELKKDIQKKIEGLEHTQEAVRFYELYEDIKKEKNLFDYDDVLENLIKIVEISEEAKDDIKEQYQYVLIDEHQDSSGVQNEFLEKVWKGEDKPNIFVVGDDRQLIYGFGGANIEYFENFKHTFGKVKLITLIENYRSTQNILDTAHVLLQSTFAEGKLKSNTKENYGIRLVEANYPRDEIIFAGIEINEKIKKGEDPNNFAILVPKNRYAKSAVTILRDMGVPVASGEKLNFFEVSEAIALLRILKIISNPADGVVVTESFFDIFSNIPPIEAHKFLYGKNMREFSLLSAIHNPSNTLFEEEKSVNDWIIKLKKWIEQSVDMNLYSLVQNIGSEFLLENAKNHEELVVRVEVVRTLLHLILSQTEKNPKITLKQFLDFADRLESYHEHIPLAVFSGSEGVKVLTLHASKGLEFDSVWIAHMDQKSFAGGKKGGFALPEILEQRVEKKDEEVLKKELYVAMTRAKRFCTISYPIRSYTGGDLELADIVANLQNNFEKQDANTTEKLILGHDPKIFIQKIVNTKNTTLEDLHKLVAVDFEDKNVSVSLLNNFFECPWKWYFRNLLQLPEPKAESLEFGSIVHGSIDKILKTNIIPNEKEIKEIVGMLVKKSGFGDERKATQLTREAFDIVSKWVTNRLPDISKNHENEKSVSIRDERFPHLNIYGKIDLIEILNQEDVRVTDFKTGSPRKNSEIQKIDDEGRMEGYMRQLAMYSFLLGENSKWRKNVVESQLEFVQADNAKEMFYKTTINNEQIDLLVRDISDYNSFVKSGEWTSRPCHFKSYGKQNAVCEYCKMGEIYK